MTKSLAAFFIAIIFSTSFAQMGGMGFGYSGGGSTVDSVRAAGSSQNLQGGAAGAIPVQTASGTTGFSAAGITGQALVSGGSGVPTWFAPAAGRVIFAGTNGVLASDAGLLFDNTLGTLSLLPSNTTGATDFLINTATKTSGNLIDLQVGGSSRCKVGFNGRMTLSNPSSIVSVIMGGTSGEIENTGGPYYITCTVASPIIFRTSNTERARVDGSGNFGIGTNSPSAVLHLKAGTASANTAPLKFTAGTNLTTPEAGAMEFDGTNLYFTPSSTRQTVTLSSDSSLKRNIVDYRDALQKVLAMRSVHFRYKVGSDTTLHVGLIAQELVHVDSSLVDYGVDGEARGVKYLEVIPVLVRAIQEQDARITALEKRNMFFGIFTGIVLVGLVVVVVRRKADSA